MAVIETFTPGDGVGKAGAAQTPARSPIIRLIALVIAFITGLAAVGFGVALLGAPSWQFAVLTAVNAIACVLCILSGTKITSSGGGMLAQALTTLLFAISLLSISLLLTGLGIATAVVFLVYIMILSSALQNEGFTDQATMTGIAFAVALALVPELVSLPQIDNPLIGILTPAALGILFMIYIALLAMQFVGSNMRSRLVTAFIVILIVPLAILTLIESRFTYNMVRDQTNQQLATAARQTVDGLDKFVKQSSDQLANAVQFNVFTRYIQMPSEQRSGSSVEAELRNTLKILANTRSSTNFYLPSYALLDINGLNIYDTDSDPQFSIGAVSTLDPLTHGKGTDESIHEYFQVPASTGFSYASPLIIDSKDQAFLYYSVPVKDEKGNIIGVLRARYNGLILQQVVRDYNGLAGAKSYVMLLDENDIRLADAYMPQYLFMSIAPLTSTKIQGLQAENRLPVNISTAQLSTNYVEFDKLIRNYMQSPYFSVELGKDNLPEVGTVYRVNAMPWRVVYVLEDFDEALLRRNQQKTISILATLLAGIVGLIAVYASKVLNQPISNLMRTAQQVSSGDLEAEAPVGGGDEFSMLGGAFNAMTQQVRGFINELEERVKARTNEFEQQNIVLSERTRQMQTVSEIARQIVSMQDIEKLLPSLTQLIAERFGFYHVAVFLVDENKEYAVLRAANSAGGQRMLARNHMLPIGRVGMVGYVTSMGEARIATDVGDEAIFFNNPDLPYTRSEMALPLKAGNEIIGALDIQSTESNAFHEDDIELYNTLADQVAIAIYNNRLYSETVRALNEAQTLHRNYLRDEWQQELTVRKTHGYLYNRRGITEQEAELPIWKSVIASGRPVVEVGKAEGEAQPTAAVAVPITVRGETIGVIHVQDQGEQRAWTEDEVSVINDVANQVAVALENARLFEATVRRAEREKKVLEITAHIRSTNEPDRMMQVAVNELQKALGATRTQIYIRKQAAETTGQPSGSPDSAPPGNGKNGSQAE